MANNPEDPLGRSADVEVPSLDRQGRGTLLAAPPEGTPHPVHGSGDGSQRILVVLRGSPQAAPLPRSTRVSPAASLHQSKQTPQAGSDFTSAVDPAPSFCQCCCPRPLEGAREDARPQSADFPSGTSVHVQRPWQGRGLYRESSRILSGRP